jgi:DNA polymerase delta subunit 2
MALRMPEMVAALQETLFAGMREQPPLPQQGGPQKYVALVSGLGVGDDMGEQARVALLVDYLAGLLGGPPEQEQVAQVMRTPQTAHRFQKRVLRPISF